MSDVVSNPMVVTYGDITLDFSKLPPTSLAAMLRRGVSHYFGSEQASKVTGLFKPDDEGKIKAEVQDTDENRAKALADFRAKAHDALIAGTVGVSVRGPSVDPITVIVRRLAKGEISDILKLQGVKPPVKVEDTVETPDGAKHTMNDLIDRRLDPSRPSGVDKHGKYGKAGESHLDRLTRDAKRIADDQAKKAKKAKEAADAEGLSGL